MKHVLLIDTTQKFTDFLKEELSIQQVSIETAEVARDAYTKMIAHLPDLVIAEFAEQQDDLLDFLQKKMSDPNARNIPVIIVGPPLERKIINTFLSYTVIKYFPRPLKFDILYQTIAERLGLSFKTDPTPCTLEMHLTGAVLFIEISLGLNRDKIALLKYKIAEAVEQNRLEKPRVLLMMSNMDLSFVDASNIVFLLDTILRNNRIHKENFKILSTSDFLADLIKGHAEYADIEVTPTITTILNPLLEQIHIANHVDTVNQRLLHSNRTLVPRTIDMSFSTDYGGTAKHPSDDGDILTIAIVDDDIVVQKILSAAFARIGARTTEFSSGIAFVNAVPEQIFDFVILDLFIPDMNGFDILDNLQRRGFTAPILVYSQATNREYVIQSLTLGAKNYLVKPQKPEVVVKTVIDILHSPS